MSAGKGKIFFLVTSLQNTWNDGSQVIAGKRTVRYKAGGRGKRERGEKRKDYVSSGARLTNPGASLSLDYLF